MDGRFSKMWLLICGVFVVQLPVTRCQHCPQDWTFHALTDSCMALIKTNYSYIDARNYCQSYSRSSKTKRNSHLVFIFDKETDNFVKGLLEEQGVDKALIGLNDRAWSGLYMWGDSNAIPADHTRWADNPHKPDFYKHAVVMTEDGWREYDQNSPTYFVCQINVDFPTAKMVCPVAEVGQDSPGIICTTDIWQPFSITHVRFMKTAAVLASCDSNKCWPGQGYGQDVDVSEPTETNSSVSWTLKLRNVRISDATGWTCSVQFNYRDSWVASQPCSLNVYIKPTDIQCSHQFVQTTVKTTCTAAQAYPQVDCSWKINNGTRLITVYDQTLSNVVVSGEKYYRATCNGSFSITNAGTYDVTVAMVPRLPNSRIESVKETSVSVAPPQQPPQLYHAGQILQSLWVDVVENQSLIITCQVPGGDPPVYRTTITCDNIPQPFESDGSSVTVDIRVTREFHGRSCTCSALHAASYTQTSSVGIRVSYPATVTSFLIASRSVDNSVKRGDKITFFCTATGIPIPQLIVQRQNGPTFTSSSTGYITYRKTATCSDTGNYVCLASNMVQGQHHQDSRVFQLEVRCTYQFTEPDCVRRSYKGQVNGAVSINLNVFGYPEATVTLTSTKHNLSSDAYTLNYTQVEPPYGTVSLVINIQNASFFQNYSLNIINTEGPLTYSFEIEEGDPVKPVSENGGVSALCVGTIVGGIVAAVIVIILLREVLSMLKKKGSRHVLEEVPESQALEDTNYLDIIDFVYAMPDNPVHDPHQAPKDPKYSEIIEFDNDMPDNPLHISNQMLLHVRGGDVEYDIDVSVL